MMIMAMSCRMNLGHTFTDLLRLKGLFPILVAVRGRVYSSCPRKCELSDKLAVVHEVSLMQESPNWMYLGILYVGPDAYV